jgi:hypothetical protein
MASSYSSSDLVKLFSGGKDSFREDVLDETTSEKLLDQLYADSSDGIGRLDLWSRVLDATKDDLLNLASASRRTISPTQTSDSYL